ncbi:MAG: 1-deoxy-D-xylulose-5-phosphate synthase [Turicibacter sp.]|nr:1-deoxy-D-xylulose-5-phosphate synthase [Turicibacter sp.]
MNIGNLKDLNIDELTQLSAEIRQFLITELSQTGGHLASNLGVVELTVALHRVFDLPMDKIIWDVGHQCYVHKILTGRSDKFATLRKFGGLSGFPKASESDCDAFDTGHSSTAISAALGYATARDLQAEDYGIVAVVGDGSMTGGLVYEALNNAGRSNTDILVVLNDNQMSISENVGAISKHLNDIRITPSYRGVKRGVHRILANIPYIGKRLDKLIERAKNAVKFMFVNGVLFEELGFEYYGPVDGHNLKDLIGTLQNLKRIKGPVLLHILTTKGKGYVQAERNPDIFHGVGAFSVETGIPSPQKTKEYSDIFGETMLKLAAQNERIVAITAAMPDGTGLCEFSKRYPTRFFDTGIAESHAAIFSAGLAKGGLIPVFVVYSTFLQRAYDQLLHDICLQKLHVVLAIDRAGITGPDGETHQGVFDLSYLSHMPNMSIMAPKNFDEFRKMLHYAVLEHNAPIAIRYPKGGEFSEKIPTTPLKYGEAEQIFDGEHIALVSVGAMIGEAVKVAEILRAAGHNPSLYNARFIKPVDKKLLKDLKNYPYVFILEDNVRLGGFGEHISGLITPKPHLFAFPDEFIEHGTRKELFKIYGMDGEAIAERILKICEL